MREKSNVVLQWENGQKLKILSFEKQLKNTGVRIGRRYPLGFQVDPMYNACIVGRKC